MDQNSPYKSIRTNRSQGNLLFPATPKIDDHFREKLKEKLYCNIPLCLNISDSATVPQTDLAILERLNNELKGINTNETTFANNVATVIITWYLVQLFYPYRKLLFQWETSLKEAINYCYSDVTIADFIRSLN